MQTIHKISYKDCIKGKKNWVSNVKSYCMTMECFWQSNSCKWSCIFKYVQTKDNWLFLAGVVN